MTREQYEIDIRNLNIPFAYTTKRYIDSLEATIKVLKDECANMTNTHAKNIANLQATIASQEIMIKDKTAFMNAIAQRKTCDGCKHNRFGCDSTGVAVDCTSLNGNCARQWYKDYYEPKAKV